MAKIFRGSKKSEFRPQLIEWVLIFLIVLFFLGILYLIHWFVVIPWVTVRMALLPKRLVWAKTLHLGEDGDDGQGAAATA